jgi:hypothetical protein
LHSKSRRRSDRRPADHTLADARELVPRAMASVFRLFLIAARATGGASVDAAPPRRLKPAAQGRGGSTE